MADLDDMLLEAATERGLELLSTNTQPTETAVVNWINEGILLILGALCPRRVRTGLWNDARLEKLSKLTVKATYTSASQGADPTAQYFLPLPVGGGAGTWDPASLNVASYYGAMRIGAGAEATRAPLREMPLPWVYTRRSGTYIASATAPVFGWAAGTPYGAGGTLGPGIMFSPGITTGVGGFIYVDFNLIKIPTRLAQSGSEDWPLDDDLMDLAMEYVKAMLWAADNGRDLGRANFHMSIFLEGLVELRRTN